MGLRMVSRSSGMGGIFPGLINTLRLPLMEWSGRAPAPQVIDAGQESKDAEHVMSELGHSRRFRDVPDESGLPPNSGRIAA